VSGSENFNRFADTRWLSILVLHRALRIVVVVGQINRPSFIRRDKAARSRSSFRLALRRSRLIFLLVPIG
jgi:hypothetical protein